VVSKGLFLLTRDQRFESFSLRRRVERTSRAGDFKHPRTVLWPPGNDRAGSRTRLLAGVSLVACKARSTIRPSLMITEISSGRCSTVMSAVGSAFQMTALPRPVVQICPGCDRGVDDIDRDVAELSYQAVALLRSKGHRARRLEDGFPVNRRLPLS